MNKTPQIMRWQNSMGLFQPAPNALQVLARVRYPSLRICCHGTGVSNLKSS